MLSAPVFDYANTLMATAIAAAVKQLSFLLKEELYYTDLCLSTDADPLNTTLTELNAGEKELFLLLTEVKGALGGSCYLLLTQKEAASLWKAALPADLTEAMQETMQSALLLEMDNIVVASAITHLANVFQCHVYGHVPSIQQLSLAEAKAVLLKEATTTQHPFYLKTYLRSQSSDFAPLLVWFFDKTFVQAIQENI